MKTPDDKQIDDNGLRFYRDELASALPDCILDFHAHVWTIDQWLGVKTDAGSAYMVTEHDYPVETLLADGAKAFPDRRYSAVCFGHPTPQVDTDATNAYLARFAGHPGVYSLLVAGGGRASRAELESQIRRNGFFGFKVLIPWSGDDYGDVRIEDMVGPTEMALADELKLVVLLHVPGAERMADPRNQEALRRLAGEYPNASIVLAHCGRCYDYGRMRRAIPALADLENVYLDTSMVMDPIVIEMLFDSIDSSRVLFATDLPVAAMRGRRVRVMDHWVDVVLPGYPESAFRVASPDIRATFMVHEIALAIKQAAEMAGLSAGHLKAVFCDNGMALLQRVMDGQQLHEIGRSRHDKDTSSGNRRGAAT